MRHIKLLCAGVIAAVLAAPCVPSAQPYERGTPERRDNLPGKWYVNGERDKLVEISSSRSGLQAKNENGDVRAPVAPERLALLTYIHVRMSQTQKARALLSEMLSRGDAPAYFVALAYVGLGEKDAAFRWLEKSVQEKWGPFNELGVEPLFDSLREDPRFPVLLRRIGLPVSTSGAGSRVEAP